MTDGLSIHPTFVDRFRQMRPHLPTEPTTEQLETWIKLADLVQDNHFRQSLRDAFQRAFSSPRARQVTAPPVTERIEGGRRAGPGCPRTPHRPARSRTASQPRLPTSPSTAIQTLSRFNGLLGRYNSLVATINGTPQGDPESTAADRDWLAPTRATPGSRSERTTEH